MGLTHISIWDVDWLVWTSFGISIISAAFGIAKLLKNGPIKMVRKDGKIGGYGTPGFILLMIVVAFHMIGKAMWMGWEFGNHPPKNVTVWMWALTCILPQLLLVKSQNNYLLYKKLCLRKKSCLISDPYYLAYQLWSHDHLPIY